MFHIASPEDILSGKTTDIYFKRTCDVLRAKGIARNVKAEFCVKKFPRDWKWGVFSGVEECVELLRNLNVRVEAMREGTIFGINDPVMTIEGEYTQFGQYETAILGLICQSSGIATRAARCKKAAGDRLVVNFGARRMHPSISPMIERNAYIGGCDGVATVKSAELIGIEPTGTIPHSLVLILGDVVNAICAFDEIIEPSVERIALVDTFEDEKTESLRAAEAMGGKLYGVRLDTPSSRRGDFYRIIEEVRWELNLRGHSHLKIFVSGGIDEEEITRLNPVVDGYGVGTAISNAPVLDFSMDIVEIDGEPIAKRGKRSGAKSVLRCPKCFKKTVVPKGKEIKECECGSDFENLLKPLVADGKLLKKLESPDEIKKYVFDQIKFYSLDG